MAESVLDIILRTIKKGNGDKEAVTGLKGVIGSVDGAVKSLTGFSLGSLTAAGALAMVVGETKKSIAEWSAYAEQMDKSSKLAGISVEDMSRLTQAADDFRVSQDALKNAMSVALNRGFVPTIENIAKLSDEFIATEDPAKRAQLAFDAFGRQWKDIAPLLLKGGDAIRAGTAAIADNLIVTDDAVQKNNDYIKAMDDLEDAWTGIKNTAAQGLIPALTNVLRALNGEEVNRAVNGYERMFKSAKDNLASFEDVDKDVNETMRDTATAAGEAAPPVDFLADATNNADAAMRKYSEALLFSIASQGLTEQQALALAQRMGLVDEKTVLATEKTADYKKMLDDGKISLDEYNILVAGLADSLDRLEDKTITVTYNQVVTGTAPGGDWKFTGGEDSTVTGAASGGPVDRGRGYFVGEYGPEWLRPKQNSEIIPNNQVNNNNQTIGPIVINAGPGTNAAKLVDEIMLEIARRTRVKTGAGAGYIGA